MEEANGSHDSSRIDSVSKSQSGNDVNADILRNRRKEQSLQQSQEAKDVNWWGQAPCDEESEPVINDCEIANKDLLPDTIEEEQQPKVKPTTNFHDSSSDRTHQADRGSHIRRRGIPGRRGHRGRGVSSQYHHRREAHMALAPKPLNTPTPKLEDDYVCRSDYEELIQEIAKLQERIKLLQRDLKEKDEELKGKDSELEGKESIIKKLRANWENWGGKGFRPDRYAAKGFMNAEEDSWRNLPEWKKKVLTKQIGDLVNSLKRGGRVAAETLDVGGWRRPSPPPSNLSRPKMVDRHSVLEQSEPESLILLDKGAKEREQSNPNSSPLESCQKSGVEPRDIIVNEYPVKLHQEQAAGAEDVPHTNHPYRNRGNEEPFNELVSPPINYYPPPPQYGGWAPNWQIPPGDYPTYYHPPPPPSWHGWSNMRFRGIPQNSPLLPRYSYPIDHPIRRHRPLPPQHHQYPPGRP